MKKIQVLLLFFLITSCSTVVYLVVSGKIQQPQNLFIKASSDCTVVTTPDKNLADEVGRAKPGTVLCLAPGKYTSYFSISVSGTKEQPIIIRSQDSNNRAVIDCSSCDIPTWQAVVTVSGSNLVLQDLDIQNTGNASTWKDSNDGVKTVHGSNLVLRNLRVTNIVGMCLLSEGYTDLFIDGGEYSNCNMENYPTDRHRGDPNWGSAIAIAHNSHRARIRNITLHDTWGEGINIWSGSSDAVVENNTLYRIWGPYIYVDRGNRVEIKNNYIYALKMPVAEPGSGNYTIGRPIEVIDENAGGVTSYPRLVSAAIYNNLIVVDESITHKTACLLVGDHRPSGIPNVYYPLEGEVKFENNTCVRAIVSHGSADNLQVNNNLFLDTANSGEYPGTYRNNIWTAGNISPYKGSNNSVQANVQLVNPLASMGAVPPSASNFKINSGTSPLINAGLAVGFSTDFLGCQRTGLPDVGAFEYAASGCSVIQPVPTAIPTATPVSTPVATATPPVSTPLHTTVPTATPVPNMTGNLLKNPNFDGSNTSYWSYHFQQGSGTFAGSNNQLKVTLTSLNGIAQLYQSSIPLKKDKQYQLKFNAQAAQSGSIAVKFIKHTANYDLLSNFASSGVVNVSVIKLTNTMQTYTIPFTSLGEQGDSRMQIVFLNTDAYTFDSFSLTEVGSGTTPQQPTPIPATPIPQLPTDSSNLLKNGDFSNGTTDWLAHFGNGSGSLVSDNKRGRVDITNVNGIAQFFQRNISVTKGRSYTVTFDAQANTAQRLYLRVIMDSSPYSFLSKFSDNTNQVTIPLSSENKTYQYSFVAQDNYSNARLQLFFENTGSVWFDNFKLN